MIRLALILAALWLAGCVRQINPGAQCRICIVDQSEFASPRSTGQFNPNNGDIWVQRNLSDDKCISASLHEFVHALEDNPGLTPRQVLRLYHSPAWPVASQDLLGD